MLVENEASLIQVKLNRPLFCLGLCLLSPSVVPKLAYTSVTPGAPPLPITNSMFPHGPVSYTDWERREETDVKQDGM